MQGYINRLFGWGHQPKKTAQDIGPPPRGKGVNAASIIMSNAPDSLVEYPPQPFDVPLYNKRLDLLKYLVENNEANAVAGEINALLTALMEQLDVKVYEPLDDMEYEVEGPYVKDGE